MKGKLIVGRVIEHKVNCACGELKDQLGKTCPKCHTKCLDVISIVDIDMDDKGSFVEIKDTSELRRFSKYSFKSDEK